MKLYTSKVSPIADELIRTLKEAGDIEVNDIPEAVLDIEAILKEYVRLDRDITDQAKDLLEQRKLSYGQFGKLKRELADGKGFVLGEESTSYLANQILESFMQSRFIEEVFADDTILRKKTKEILRKNMLVDEELDAEVRQRIKNLEEGSSGWDVEYKRAMDQIKLKHGLKE
jgi:uncharacterized protein